MYLLCCYGMASRQKWLLVPPLMLARIASAPSMCARLAHWFTWDWYFKWKISDLSCSHSTCKVKVITDILLFVFRCMPHCIHTALVATFGTQKDPAKCSNHLCRYNETSTRTVVRELSASTERHRPSPSFSQQNWFRFTNKSYLTLKQKLLNS